MTQYRLKGDRYSKYSFKATVDVYLIQISKFLLLGDSITKLDSMVTVYNLKYQIVQRGMCYVPQIKNVFASLSIEENLEMGAFVRSGSLTQLKEQIYTMFPVLKTRRKQAAGTLSGGERQMLAMGRALMLDPDLLVLDEPSAALSPILVSNVFEQIKAVNSLGKAIILVEQNAKRALELADRGYVLENGRDRFEGTGAELLNDPKVGELYLGAAYNKAA